MQYPNVSILNLKKTLLKEHWVFTATWFSCLSMRLFLFWSRWVAAGKWILVVIKTLSTQSIVGTNEASTYICNWDSKRFQPFITKDFLRIILINNVKAMHIRWQWMQFVWSRDLSSLIPHKFKTEQNLTFKNAALCINFKFEIDHAESAS